MDHRFTLRCRPALIAFAVLAAACAQARAAEHVTLRNGFELDCLRRQQIGDRVRLYLLPDASAHAPATTGDAGYLEVPASAVLRVETIPDPPASPAAQPAPASTPAAKTPFTPAVMSQMLDRAGASHNIDTDLLASIVFAESAGNPRAVSRAGAQGLMQLMPATASILGVQNSFAPDQNISGGAAYLDQLLTRYDPNNDTRGLELAVAAYNAGPAAVDLYHGIPPYAETRAYVARVVHEFNRRKLAALRANSSEARSGQRASTR